MAEQSTSRNKSTMSKREEEMHQARLRQQELLNEKAREALQKQKEMKKTAGTDQSSVQTDVEVSKSVKSASSKSKPAKLSTGYNPMQPWSASSGGGTYRYIKICLPLSILLYGSVLQ
jgi:hypothetical protein